MNSESSVFISALNYYDEHQFNNRHVVEVERRHIIKPTNDNNFESTKLELFGKNDQSIGIYNASIVGLYDNFHHFFTWSWAINAYGKNITKTAIQLFNYSSLLHRFTI